MISEKMRMRIVVIAETNPNHWLPKASSTCWPTPAAPMVWAMVLRLSMAAMALALSCLYFLNKVAGLNPSSSRMVIYDNGVDMSTASNMEQRNDTDNAPNR